MSWSWGSRSAKSGTVSMGKTDLESGLAGRKGTVADARSARSWPHYKLQYLAHDNTLPNNEDLKWDKYAKPYDIPGEGGKMIHATAKAIAHQMEVAKHASADADEQLKREFKDWLQGKHDDNVKQRPYENLPGRAARRWTYGSMPRGGADATGNTAAGALMRGWKPTWWGNAQLTHLPGVREFLREEAMAADDESFAMNLLAEHGPQNLEQAWMYFKHWVKGVPVSSEIKNGGSATADVGPHGGFGNHKADGFNNQDEGVVLNPKPKSSSRYRNWGSGTGGGTSSGAGTSTEAGTNTDVRAFTTTGTDAGGWQWGRDVNVQTEYDPYETEKAYDELNDAHEKLKVEVSDANQKAQEEAAGRLAIQIALQDAEAQGDALMKKEVELVLKHQKQLGQIRDDHRNELANVRATLAAAVADLKQADEERATADEMSAKAAKVHKAALEAFEVERSSRTDVVDALLALKKQTTTTSQFELLPQNNIDTSWRPVPTWMWPRTTPSAPSLTAPENVPMVTPGAYAAANWSDRSDRGAGGQDWYKAVASSTVGTKAPVRTSAEVSRLQAAAKWPTNYDVPEPPNTITPPQSMIDAAKRSSNEDFTI